VEIRIQNSPLDVEAGDTAFVLDDQGSAMTTLILSVQGFPPIQHDEPHKGSLTKVLNLKKGTYLCNIYIASYRYGAVGPTYKSKVTVDGTTVATAEGSIAKDESERDDQEFELVVA
jgi:hypothetical protein